MKNYKQLDDDIIYYTLYTDLQKLHSSYIGTMNKIQFYCPISDILYGEFESQLEDQIVGFYE